MIQGEILVIKFISENGFAPCPIKIGEITALDHESWDNSMENCVFEAQGLSLLPHTLFTSA